MITEVLNDQPKLGASYTQKQSFYEECWFSLNLKSIKRSLAIDLNVNILQFTENYHKIDNIKCIHKTIQQKLSCQNFHPWPSSIPQMDSHPSLSITIHPSPPKKNSASQTDCAPSGFCCNITLEGAVVPRFGIRPTWAWQQKVHQKRLEQPQKLPRVADEIDWIRWEMYQKYWSSVGCFRFISLERMEGVVSLCWWGWAMAGDITSTSWWLEQQSFTWSPLRQRTKVAYTLWWKSHVVR